MTDERIDRIAELTVKGMPDGIQGFTKEWGWRQFARNLAEILSTTAAPQARSSALTEAQIEEGRRATFSTDNPFCPCERKTMLKAVRWAERKHGILAADSMEAK